MKLCELEQAIKTLKKAKGVNKDTRVYFQYKEEGQDIKWTTEALIRAVNYTYLSGAQEVQIEITML